MPELIKYLLVYALSGFKFIFGPTMGAAYGFSVLVTGILTTLGMMTAVYIISYFGPQIRSIMLKLFGKRKKAIIFSPSRRRFVKIWKRYGIQGIAFLTPLLLTPIGGAFFANAMGVQRKDIFKWMWIFGSFWSFVLSAVVQYAAHLIVEFKNL
ncbi:MAG: hypothetical protein ACFHWX_00295 [Bacteroidota bacterium]